MATIERILNHNFSRKFQVKNIAKVDILRQRDFVHYLFVIAV